MSVAGLRQISKGILGNPGAVCYTYPIVFERLAHLTYVYPKRILVAFAIFAVGSIAIAGSVEERLKPAGGRR